MNRLKYDIELAKLYDNTDALGRRNLQSYINAYSLSPSVTLGLTFFLGFLGVDRFRLGLWGTALIKLLILFPLLLTGDILLEIEASKQGVSSFDEYFVPSLQVYTFQLFSGLTQIILYLDGLFTPGLTRDRNLKRIKAEFAKSQPTPPASSDTEASSPAPP